MGACLAAAIPAVRRVAVRRVAVRRRAWMEVNMTGNDSWRRLIRYESVLDWRLCEGSGVILSASLSSSLSSGARQPKYLRRKVTHAFSTDSCLPLCVLPDDRACDLFGGCAYPGAGIAAGAADLRGPGDGQQAAY